MIYAIITKEQAMMFFPDGNIPDWVIVSEPVKNEINSDCEVQDNENYKYEQWKCL